MTKLDRIVIRALLNGHVAFDDKVPNRFARIGKVELYRPVVGNGRWAVLFGHTTRDHSLDLGWCAHTAMMIAMRYQK